MVLLRHTLPDASWHFDWLIHRDRPRAADSAAALGDDAKVLCAFRTLIHPATASAAAPGGEPFDAVALPDHRRLYLYYEGPIAHASRPTAAGESPVPAGAMQLGADAQKGLTGSTPMIHDRGSVARVASGWAQWVLASADAITLVGSLGDRAVHTWIGRRIATDQWRFTVGPAPHAGSAEG